MPTAIAIERTLIIAKIEVLWNEYFAYDGNESRHAVAARQELMGEIKDLTRQLENLLQLDHLWPRS